MCFYDQLTDKQNKRKTLERFYGARTDDGSAEHEQPLWKIKQLRSLVFAFAFPRPKAEKIKCTRTQHAQGWTFCFHSHGWLRTFPFSVEGTGRRRRHKKNEQNNLLEAYLMCMVNDSMEKVNKRLYFRKNATWDWRMSEVGKSVDRIQSLQGDNCGDSI